MCISKFQKVSVILIAFFILGMLTACGKSPTIQTNAGTVTQEADNETQRQTSVPDSTNALDAGQTISPQEIIDGLNNVDITVESAKIVVQDEELKSLYPDMIYVIVKYYGTNATIKNLEIAYLAFDKGGYPIKIVGQLSFSDGDYEVYARAEDVNLEVGQKYGENNGYTLDEACGKRIKYVMACVVKADLYNDQVWENPLYDAWSTTFKDKPLPDFLKQN